MEENKIKPVIGGAQNKKVETYAGDMAKVIQGGQGGIIKKMIHEQEDKETERKNFSPESAKNRTFLILSTILVFLAAGTILFILTNPQVTTVSIPPQFSPLISTDKAQVLEIGGLSKDEASQTLRNKVSTTEVKAGGIEGLYLTENKSVVGLRRFLTLIKANLDQTQLNFVDDNFLLGIFNKDTKDLFFLLKVRSAADIFDPMKIWERKMFSDMHGFFGVDITPDTNYLLTKDFEDGYVSNKNVRILYDNAGKIVMAYAFADDSSVVITNTTEAINEVILRLSASQIKK